MTDLEWSKYGGEKSEQDIINLLLQLRRVNWSEYQRAKFICYLAVSSECKKQGIELNERPSSGKIIQFRTE